jgi:hypothetical protein
MNTISHPPSTGAASKELSTGDLIMFTVALVIIAISMGTWVLWQVLS